MKAKPNSTQLAQFQTVKDPAEFLAGGAADRAEKDLSQPQQPQQPHFDASKIRDQKVFRLPLDLISLLKREAFERSEKTGARVTETELVEQALREFFR